MVFESGLWHPQRGNVTWHKCCPFQRLSGCRELFHLHQREARAALTATSSKLRRRCLTLELGAASAQTTLSRKSEIHSPSGYFQSYARTPYCICPIFVHPLFTMFEPHIQKWVIFVRRRPCVCDTFRVESPPLHEKKKRIWHRLPPPPLRGQQQLNFPNVKNDAGQKQNSQCFLRRRRRPKAGDAFTRTRLMPTFGVSAALSVEHCRPQAGIRPTTHGPDLAVRLHPIENLLPSNPQRHSER